MDSVPPTISIGSLGPPVSMVNTTERQRLFYPIFVALFGGPYISVTGRKFAKESDFRETVVIHTRDVTYPAQLRLENVSLDAVDICTLEDFIIGHIILPLNLQDGTKTALMKAFKETYMSLISDPRLGTVEKRW